jgi:hypothetical protein
MNMEIGREIIKLDKPTTQVKVYGAEIKKAKQDRLGKVYIWVKNNG